MIGISRKCHCHRHRFTQHTFDTTSNTELEIDLRQFFFTGFRSALHSPALGWWTAAVVVWELIMRHMLGSIMMWGSVLVIWGWRWDMWCLLRMVMRWWGWVWWMRCGMLMELNMHTLELMATRLIDTPPLSLPLSGWICCARFLLCFLLCSLLLYLFFFRRPFRLTSFYAHFTFYVLHRPKKKLNTLRLCLLCALTKL